MTIEKKGRLWYTFPINSKRKIFVDSASFQKVTQVKKEMVKHGYKKELFEVTYDFTVKSEYRTIRECGAILETITKRLGVPINSGIVLKEFLNLISVAK